MGLFISIYISCIIEIYSAMSDTALQLQLQPMQMPFLQLPLFAETLCMNNLAEKLRSGLVF